MLDSFLTNKAPTDNSKETSYTVDDAISFIGIGPFQWKILIVSGLLWAADGIEIMILTFLLPELQTEWNLTDAETGTVGSVVFAGGLFGYIFWANVSDRVGRKWTIVGTNTGQLIFGMLSAASWDIYSMIITRFITGFCLGGSSVSYTLYAEYAPKRLRGKLLILQQSFWAVGVTVNALIAWFTLELLDWRWYLIISSIPLFITLVFAIRLPESVRYLVAINKFEEAENILNNALSQNKGISSANNKIKLIKSDEIIVAKRGNFLEVFDVKYFKITIVLFNVAWLTTFCYYGISFFSERFFDKVTENNDQHAGEKYWKVVVTAASEIPGVLVAILTLDRYGRKNSLIANFAGFSITSFILMDHSIQNNIAISVPLSFLGRMCISIVFLVVYVYFSEYYPTQIRNTALGLSVGLNRFAGMGATYISQFNDMTYVFYLYALAGAVGAICSCMLQETQDNNMTDYQVSVKQRNDVNNNDLNKGSISMH